MAKGDKVLWEENVYYKQNRALLLRGDEIYLRNTWSGKEILIGKIPENEHPLEAN